MTFCGLFFFFFNDTATTEIYTLSLHDALPISNQTINLPHIKLGPITPIPTSISLSARDRKSTRLNSSHVRISYAVFCLKKKNKQPTTSTHTPPPYPAPSPQLPRSHPQRPPPRI